MGRPTFAAHMSAFDPKRTFTFSFPDADGVAAMDLFVVPTVSCRLLYGLLIMGHGRRQILWLGVTAHPTAEWIANQLTAACGWEQLPRYLIRDRDACYGGIFVRRVRSLGIRDHPTSARSYDSYASYVGYGSKVMMCAPRPEEESYGYVRW